MRAAPAADMHAELRSTAAEAPLQRPDDARGDARGVPVHAHDRAEGLEPERIGEPPQQFVAAVMLDDGLAHHRAEPRHALAEPCRHAAAMQRKVGTACSLRQRPLSLAGTRPSATEAATAVGRSWPTVFRLLFTPDCRLEGMHFTSDRVTRQWQDHPACGGRLRGLCVFHAGKSRPADRSDIGARPCLGCAVIIPSLIVLLISILAVFGIHF